MHMAPTNAFSGICAPAGAAPIWWTRREFMRLAAAAVAGAGTVNADTSVVRLPDPMRDGARPLEWALANRRSVRVYGRRDLTLMEVGQLLWAAQGVTDAGGLRAAPSAGALYPLELDVVAGTVSNLAPGIYRYDGAAHALARRVSGDRRPALMQAALAQQFVTSAPAAIVVSAVYARTTGKYAERGRRYVHMEAGHAAQNVYLQAMTLGLATVAVGAFDDARVQRAIDAAENEYPLYIMPVGAPAGSPGPSRSVS
jgi:SagB-type dehydrogenase family enzyme